MFFWLQNKLFNSKAFSLTELMVVLVLIGVISTVISGLFSNSQKSYLFLGGTIDNMQEARLGSDTLANDLRTVVSITAVSSASSSDSISFSEDINGDGTNETVAYIADYTNHKITKQIGSSPSQNLIIGITNTASSRVFTYYDQQNSLITDASKYTTNTKLIDISLKVDQSTTDYPARETILDTRVALRNLHERH